MPQPANLEGKVVAITGATDGLGKALILRLAEEKPQKVILLARNPVKAEKIQEQLKGKNVASSIILGDMSLVKEVRRMGQELAKEERIDLLISNAGIFNTTKEKTMTEEGFEVHFATNYLSMVVLLQAVTPLLQRSNGRVVVTGSFTSYEWVHGKLNEANLQGEQETHPANGIPQQTLYAQAKLYQHLWVSQYDAVPVTVVCPGQVVTNLDSYNVAGPLNPIAHLAFRWMTGTRTVDVGICTLLYASLAPQGDGPVYLDWNKFGSPTVRPAVALGKYPNYGVEMDQEQWNADSKRIVEITEKLLQSHADASCSEAMEC